MVDPENLAPGEPVLVIAGDADAESWTLVALDPGKVFAYLRPPDLDWTLEVYLRELRPPTASLPTWSYACSTFPVPPVDGEM